MKLFGSRVKFFNKKYDYMGSLVDIINKMPKDSGLQFIDKLEDDEMIRSVFIVSGEARRQL